MSIEKDILKAINDLRTNPKGFADKIAESKKYFKENSNIWKHPNAKAGIKTEEGPKAYDEAIDFLKKKAVAVEALTPSKGLNKIAGDFLAAYQKDADANVEIDEVVSKYGNFTGNFRRLVQFGSDIAEQIIINLVVGDGDKSRGHRDALLSDNLKKAGIAHGPHDTYRQCTVITACTKFENTKDSDDTA